jgi:hypothetical protein
MRPLPHPEPVQRATRAYLAEPVTAVLRLKDGRRLSTKLKTVSLTGGLLAVPHPVDAGSTGKLMFLTGAGMVLAQAQMLTPMSWRLQPFRFLALDADEESLLRSTVESHLAQKRREPGLIERSRAW